MRKTLFWLKWSWAQLTSMRTALILLFLLALAAIPGSLIPQRSSAPVEVMLFKQANPTWDPLFEAIGFYHVYTSPAFSAVYLLLFVSLIGCILPRIGKYFRTLRKPPPKLPQNLERLPANASGELAIDRAASLEQGLSWLRGKRYRVRRFDDGISAERGYLREAGNLVFHLSLVFVLVGMAWSNLLGFHGTAVVVEGRGFTNVVTQYDDFTTGMWTKAEDLEPFSVQVKKFNAAFEMGKVQRGAARRFDAEVSVTDASGTRDQTLTVNEPIITAGGTQVNLIGHGYAPSFTIKDGQGNVAFSGPVVFLPQDGNFASKGVIKVPDARPYQLAFEAYFFPTAQLGQNGPRSIFPDALSPEVYLTGWWGNPRVESGVPESVFSINKEGLEQIPGDGGQPLTARMLPGAGFTLPNGLGSITFDGWSRWVNLQSSRTPGNPLTLISLLIGLAGLSASLYVRPRRLFVRYLDQQVVVAGLDRADAATGLEAEVAALLLAVTGRSDLGSEEDQNDEENPT